MESEALHLLLVEDNPGDAKLLRVLLREAALPHRLTHVERLEEARATLRSDPVDVLLLDLSLPDGHGLETVTRMLTAAPEAPIIVLTGLDDETTALRAMQAGAQDYLVKGQVDGGILSRSIRYARERKLLELERAQLLEREREARAAAEQAVSARDEVLRVVAHDLGNGLSAVQVTSWVLLRTLAEEGREGEARKRVENIRILTEQMQRLRQDLLDVALLDAGQLTVSTGPVSPGTLVDDVAARYQPLAEERGVRLCSQIDPHLPLVTADANRINQALTNLVTNAIKFTPAEGSVTVRAVADDGGVRFEVKDTGRGISEQDLPRIFERFWTRREGNPHGAGLGLAITNGIVEAHGSSMRVESRAGEGSTFFFTLPAHPG